MDFPIYCSPLAPPLTKRWYVLRHGRSEANEAGIVASQLANAEHAYGLTGRGRSEVDRNVRAGLACLEDAPPLLILTSPFLRTRQTAEIAGEILGSGPKVDLRLSERDFGDYELGSDRYYQEVWDADARCPWVAPGRAESVYQVAQRTTDLVLEVDGGGGFNSCLLVTHCDIAMILTCAFQNIDPRHHRSLDPIGTGEVRRLRQASSKGAADQ